MTISSSHHLKHRRCHTNFHFTSTLQCASLVIIIVAFIELSGISQKLVDAYSSASSTLPTFSPKNTADAFSIQPKNLALLSTKSSTQKQKDYKLRMRNNRAKLNFLYQEAKPTISFAEYVTSIKTKPLTHRIPSFALEIHWSKNTPEDKVCRIHNACIRSDGSVLIHPFLKPKENRLRECGIRKVEYMHSEKDYNQSDSDNANIDIFGIEPARYHIPHFLTDVLPMIYASEVLRPTSSGMRIKRKCETPQKKRCNKKLLREQLYPGLHVEDRAGQLPVSAWVPSLTAILPGRPIPRFPSHIFKHTKKACFRSIVSYELGSYLRVGSEWFRQTNVFENYGITRESVLRNSTEKCSVHISILNRYGWHTRGGFLLGRDIVNVNQLIEKIKKFATAEKNKKLDVKVSIEYFENKSFAEQVRIMQRADVILGVHGAGLGNLMFARQDTPFLEVLPFTYYAGPFDSIASALNLDYERMIAEPDTKNFFDCMEARARRLNDESIARKAKILWREAVKRRKESGKLNYLNCHKFRSAALSPMKLCSRTQRMKVDAEKTAAKLIEMAHHVCGKR